MGSGTESALRIMACVHLILTAMILGVGVAKMLTPQSAEDKGTEAHRDTATVERLRQPVIDTSRLVAHQHRSHLHLGVPQLVNTVVR